MMHEGIGDTSSENHVGVEMTKRWGDVAVPASPKPQYEGHKAVRFPTYFVSIQTRLVSGYLHAGVFL